MKVSRAMCVLRRRALVLARAREVTFVFLNCGGDDGSTFMVCRAAGGASVCGLPWR